MPTFGPIRGSSSIPMPPANATSPPTTRRHITTTTTAPSRPQAPPRHHPVRRPPPPSHHHVTRRPPPPTFPRNRPHPGRHVIAGQRQRQRAQPPVPRHRQRYQRGGDRGRMGGDTGRGRGYRQGRRGSRRSPEFLSTTGGGVCNPHTAPFPLIYPPVIGGGGSLTMGAAYHLHAAPRVTSFTPPRWGVFFLRR
jgi:hypothetical protein